MHKDNRCVGYRKQAILTSSKTTAEVLTRGYLETRSSRGAGSESQQLRDKPWASPYFRMGKLDPRGGGGSHMVTSQFEAELGPDC